MTSLHSMPPDEIVQHLIDLAIAIRDQDSSADAEELAETARAVVRRMPDHQHWGGMRRCPQEPLVDLMRRTMNGDGFLATTVGEIRAAVVANGSFCEPFKLLGGYSLVPLPREIPEDDATQVLLYDGKRGLVLSAVGRRDEGELGRHREWLLRELRRGEMEQGGVR